MEKLSCDNCEIKFKRLRKYKSQLLCYECYRSSHIFLHLGPLKFNEPLKRTGSYALSLTDSQYKFLESRILELGITKTAYMRELIISDMLNQNKKNETITKKTRN